MTTISFKDLSIDDLEFSNPEKLGNSYICNLYHDDSLVYIQTPILKINDIKWANGDEGDNYIEFSSDNKEFIDFLLEMDENCVRCTFDNSDNWFKKDIPYEAIENMYNIKDVYEHENEYTSKLRVPVLNNKVQCNIFNADKEMIEIRDLNKEDTKNVIMILHFKGLRILKESFYLDCYINQIKVVDIKKFNILKEYSIIDEGNNSENIDENIFSEEMKEIVDQEKLQKIKSENLKQSKLEQINKLKEELEKLNN